MPLLAFLSSSPKEVGEASIEQIVAMAGDGVLRDTGSCCAELREYLRQAETVKLEAYIEHCLLSGFNKSGLVFQDLINELARRLDYKVTNGKYQGTVNAIGFDGIWTSPEGHTIVAEVKTTDAYTVKLEQIAAYRTKLLDAKEINQPSSVLIVVGRQDTGELEAQIRGSRHAWDVRVISAEALLKLVKLKENSEEPETGLKIRNLLAPMEFTRLDDLVDVMFTAVTDIETGIAEAVTENVAVDSGPKVEGEGSGWQFTDTAVLDAKRNEIVDALSRRVGSKLIKKSRALYWDSSHEKRIACSISKRYDKGAYSYWYAFHPEWNGFLNDAQVGFFVLGCMDLQHAFAIPHTVLKAHLGVLNTTTTAKKTYWHIHLIDTDSGMGLVLPNSGHLPLDQYLVSIAN